MAVRAEEERKRIEELHRKEEQAAEQRRNAEEERLKQVVLETERRLDEERRRLAEEKKKIEEQLRRQVEEERVRMEEARKKQVELEADARRIVEERAKKKVEEEYQKRLAEERERLAEEQRRQFEEERKKIEDEPGGGSRRTSGAARKRSVSGWRRKGGNPRRKTGATARRRKRNAGGRRTRPGNTKKPSARRSKRDAGSHRKKDPRVSRAGKGIRRPRPVREALKEVTKVFRLDPAKRRTRANSSRPCMRRARSLSAGKRKRAHSRRNSATRWRSSSESSPSRPGWREEVQQQRAIREAKIAGCLQKTRDYTRDGMYDKALTEIETVYAMDPGKCRSPGIRAERPDDPAEGRRGTVGVRAEVATGRCLAQGRNRTGLKSAEKGRELLHRESMNTYRAMMRQAWASGEPATEDRSMLDVVRLSLGIRRASTKRSSATPGWRRIRRRCA